MNKQYQTEKVGKHFVLRDKENKAFYSKVLSEDTPCDGCIHVSACGKERKACYAFALYVHSGTVDWTVPRLPTRSLYSRIMWTDDPTLIRQINKEMRERISHA